MSAPGLAAAGAAGFAGVALLVTIVGPLGPGRRRVLLAMGFVAAAVAGVVGGGAPTGSEAVDAMWRGGAAAAVVALATTASHRACLLASAAGVALSVGSDIAWLAAAAFGGGLAAVLGTRGGAGFLRPLVGATLGALVLRLDRTGGAVTDAALAVVPLLPMALSGLIRASRPQREALARAAVLGSSAVLLVLASWATAAVGARASLLRGVESTTSGLGAARGGERARAAREFSAAAEAFEEGRRDLSSWWARPVLALPVAGRNARALDQMATVGRHLAGTAAATVLEADPESVRMVGGTLPLDRVHALQAPLERSLDVLERSAASLGESRSPLLVPPVADRLARFSAHVARARRDAKVAARAVRVIPALLGADGPRRYFLAIQTPSELRGTGGLIGNFGEVVAEGGRVTLTRIGRSSDLNEGGNPETRQIHGAPAYLRRYGAFMPAREWRNVNMSPDFPTVARVIADLYPQSGGRPLDGVIAIDPVGLAALLRLTGPVSVPGLPSPLTDANAAEELLFRQYIRFEGPADLRVEFLGTATATIWAQLTRTALPGPAEIGAAVAPAVRGKHLLMHSAHAGEQRFFELTGLDGGLPPPGRDSLAVISQNAGGNKLDWFLHRSVRHEVSVDPATGEVRATLHVRLENRVPPSRFPSIVVDNLRAGGVQGHNYSYLSVLTPWLLQRAELDGRPLTLDVDDEDSARYAYSTFVDIPPGGAVEATFHLRGVLADARHYSLHLWRQPTVHTDRFDLRVSLAAGWRAEGPRGLVAAGRAGQLRADLKLHRDMVVGFEAEEDR